MTPNPSRPEPSKATTTSLVSAPVGVPSMWLMRRGRVFAVVAAALLMGCGGDEAALTASGSVDGVSAEGRIAVLRSTDGVSAVWSGEPDGDELYIHSPRGLWSSDADLSRGGDRVAFVVDDDGNSDVYVVLTVSGDVVAGRGGFAQNITNTSVTEMMPSWSPDGDELAFVRSSSEDSSMLTDANIFTMSAQGEEVRQITNDGKSVNPAWSPMGDRIAWVRYSDDPDESEIYMSLEDGSQAVQVTELGMRIDRIAWSPDGESIAFEVSSATDVSGQGIMTVDTATGRITELADTSSRSAHPGWSSDGTRIAFRSWQPT